MYRREAISSWKSQNYDAAVGALYAFNALLPEEYQVKLSNQMFEEKTKQDIIATCNKCSVQTDFKTIVVFDLLLSLTSSLVSGVEYEKIWICKECKNENRLLNTKLVQNILQEPYHLKVVKLPPERSQGMMDRTKFHITFSLWFWSFLNELEAEAAKFRDDNWNKGSNLFDDADVDTTGEEDAT